MGNLIATVSQPWAFDSTTKLHVCPGKDGELGISCTVSEVNLLYSYIRDPDLFIYGYFGAMIRMLLYFSWKKTNFSSSSQTCNLLSSR